MCIRCSHGIAQGLLTTWPKSSTDANCWRSSLASVPSARTTSRSLVSQDRAGAGYLGITSLQQILADELDGGVELKVGVLFLGEPMAFILGHEMPHWRALFL
jgi:hypothetical protein